MSGKRGPRRPPTTYLPGEGVDELERYEREAGWRAGE